MLVGKLVILVLVISLAAWLVRVELAHVHYGQARYVGMGTLDVEGNPLVLWGVNLPEVDGTCGRLEERWPCGAHATAAAILRVSRGNVICLEQGEAEGGARPAKCFTTRNLLTWSDMGRTLVRQGWAIPDLKVSDEYLPEADAAKQAGAGLWGSGPDR